MMHTRSAADKSAALISLLALLYLTVGSLVLHPHFHDHPKPEKSSSYFNFQSEKYVSYHQCSQNHKHAPHHSAADQDSDENCPVCEILTCCWFAPFNTNQIVFFLDSSTLFPLLYSSSNDFYQPSVQRIRGPPENHLFIN